jgi:hypothetical protein
MTKRRLRFATFVLFAIGMAAHAKYLPPVDRIVINEVLQPTPVEHCFGLYLPHQGRYYAEILRDDAIPATGGTTIDFSMRVDGGRKNYLNRRFVRQMSAEQSGATVLWFNSPYDVPTRRELSLCVSAHNDSASLLRIQISRKLELLPIVR